MDWKATKIVQVPISKITFDPRNTRTHSETQVQQIARSIKEFGWYAPVFLDKKNILIAGEGRLRAGQLLNVESVPAIILDHLSERQRRAVALLDNKIAQNAGWDFERLSEELSELAELDFDLNVTGFDEQEVDALLKNAPSILPDESETSIEVKAHKRKANQTPKKKKPKTCPHCGGELPSDSE